MTAITFPFRIDAHGKVADTRDPRKIRQDRVRAVLNTQLGDRAMRPEFGFDGEGLIMDLERVGENEVARRIGVAFTNHLPDLHLSGVSLTYGEDSQTGRVLVEFNGPDGSTDATSVDFIDGMLVSDPYSTSEVTL